MSAMASAATDAAPTVVDAARVWLAHTFPAPVSTFASVFRYDAVAAAEENHDVDAASAEWPNAEAADD